MAASLTGRVRGTLLTTATLVGALATLFLLLALPQATGGVFVDCSKGSDTATGASPTTAYRTLKRALADLQARNLAAHGDTPTPTAVVTITGVCYQSEPLRLNASHAHTRCVYICTGWY